MKSAGLNSVCQFFKAMKQIIYVGGGPRDNVGD